MRITFIRVPVNLAACSKIVFVQCRNRWATRFASFRRHSRCRSAERHETISANGIGLVDPPLSG